MEKEEYMLNKFKNHLPEGVVLSSAKRQNNSKKYNITIEFEGVSGQCEVPIQVTPGMEEQVCNSALNTAMSTIWFQKGNVQEAQRWLEGKYSKQLENETKIRDEAVRRKNTRLEELPPEELLAEFTRIVAKTVLYPENKSYCKKKESVEKELLRRLGVNTGNNSGGKIIKYRPRSRELNEEMEKERTFDSIDSMFDFIVKDFQQDWGKGWFSKEDLSIEEEPWKDRRIDWKECRYVYVRRMGKDVYTTPQCIGYCSFEDTDKQK